MSDVLKSAGLFTGFAAVVGAVGGVVAIALPFLFNLGAAVVAEVLSH